MHLRIETHWNVGGKREGAITFKTCDEAPCDQVVCVCTRAHVHVCVGGGVHECLVTQLCPARCDPWTGAPQAPLSMPFPARMLECIAVPNLFNNYTRWNVRTRRRIQACLQRQLHNRIKRVIEIRSCLFVNGLTEELVLRLSLMSVN